MSNMSIQRLFLVFLWFTTVSGLYFHIGETEKKCFIEEIPDETMVVGRYKVQIFDKNVNDYVPTVQGLGMHVEIKDTDSKIVLSRTYASEGRFTFTSHSAGEHIMCLHSNSSAWFSSGQLRVHLDIQVGEHAVDYQQIQAKDKLSELQLRIRQLLDQVEQITKEQNYQRTREERFRHTSESTNQRVFWWSVGQTGALILIGLLQVRHLKKFFISKKLV
ncbi:transmembrane emp24 domain-containing protein eca-like isoform X3 [Mercenaria mercenaria]|uniref:transmembrane emp24 domain-containing protein eca-like isoform X3 n=1 Tax=Mercenaria mercenaria TaxID=6596 RepID=UPI001E1D9133|nr:transmembrane emp24 domain-containing protein eca-like isoform X3 [Mercenaria mercenaria]